MTADPRPAVDPRFTAYRAHPTIGARNELVEHHLDLARAFARRYRRRGVEDDDLDQVAILALVKAVERFDPEVGVRFSTFAGRTIDGELKRHFRDKAWTVRVPRSAQERSLQVRRVSEQMTQQLGRSPTVPELADRMGVEVDDVLTALEAAHAFWPDSLDRPTGPDDTDRVVDALGADDEALAAVDTTDELRDLLDHLDERERRIVELRFVAELSQRQIADQIGISQMHVSRLLRRALARLREAATS